MNKAKEFLESKGLRLKDWYGTAKAGKLKEIDLEALLVEYCDHVQAYQNKAIIKHLAKISELETKISLLTKEQ